MRNLIYVTILAVLTAGQVARADDKDPDMQGPPTKEPVRSGATVTMTLGPGEIHEIHDSGGGPEQRFEGAAFSLRVGTALSEKAALEAMIDFVQGDGIKSYILGGSLKLYQTDALYLRLGAGLGVLSLDAGGSAAGMSTGGMDLTGVAGVLAVGYEWFQLQDIGLISELEIAANRLTDSGVNTTIGNAQLTFGITWY